MLSRMIGNDCFRYESADQGPRFLGERCLEERKDCEGQVAPDRKRVWDKRMYHFQNNCWWCFSSFVHCHHRRHHLHHHLLPPSSSPSSSSPSSWPRSGDLCGGESTEVRGCRRGDCQEKAKDATVQVVVYYCLIIRMKTMIIMMISYIFSLICSMQG